jgi:uncharacterized membrane protein
MQNRNAGVIATIIAVLLCGCPGLILACFGAIFALVSFMPGADIDIFGSSDPTAARMGGIGGLCLGVVFIVLTAVVAYITLRRKSDLSKPAQAVVDVVESAPVPPEAAETRKIVEDEPLPPPS